MYKLKQGTSRDLGSSHRILSSSEKLLAKIDFANDIHFGHSKERMEAIERQVDSLKMGLIDHYLPGIEGEPRAFAKAIMDTGFLLLSGRSLRTMVTRPNQSRNIVSDISDLNDIGNFIQKSLESLQTAYEDIAEKLEAQANVIENEKHWLEKTYQSIQVYGKTKFLQLSLIHI